MAGDANLAGRNAKAWVTVENKNKIRLGGFWTITSHFTLHTSHCLKGCGKRCGCAFFDWGERKRGLRQMAYDGSVKFDTKLDNAGLQSGLAKATAAIGTALAAAAAAAVKVGSEFEASMSQVYAVSRASTEEAEALKNAAIEAGQATQFSASQSADALQYLSLAGYSAEESIEALPKVLNLAAAGGMDLAYASDLLTDSMAVMGLGIEDMDNFSDQLAMAASKSNTSVAQLGEAVLVAGGQAKTCGMDVTDMNTALGILADNGIKGSEGGTALRNALKNLYTPTSSAAKVLDNLGIVTSDSEGNLRDMQDVLIDLNGVLSEMTEADRTVAMGDIFDTRTIAAATALLDNCGERWSELEGYLSDCEGAASEMADTMNDNLAGKMKLVASAAEACGIAFYDHISEPLKEAADDGAKYIQELAKSLTDGKLAGAAEDIGEGLGAIVSAAVKLANTALPPLINVVSVLCSNLDLASAAATGFLTKMALSAAIPAFTNFIKGASAAVLAFNEAELIMLETGTANKVGLGLLQAVYGVLTKQITAASAAQAIFNALSPVLIIAGVVAAIAGAVVIYKRLTKVTGEAAEKIEALNEANEETAKKVEATKEKFDELTGAIESANEAYEDSIVSSEAEAATAEALADELDKLIDKEDKSEEEKKLMADVVDRLNEIVPDLKLNYDKTTDTLTDLDGKIVDSTTHLRDQIEAMKEAAKTEALTELYKEYAKQQTEAKLGMDDAAEDLITATEKYNNAKAAYDEAVERYENAKNNPVAGEAGGNPLALKRIKNEVNETKAALDEAEANLEATEETFEGFVTEYNNIGQKMAGVWDEYVISVEGVDEATQGAVDDVNNSIEGLSDAQEKLRIFSLSINSLVDKGMYDEAKDKLSKFIEENGNATEALNIYFAALDKVNSETEEIDTSGAVTEIENVGSAANGIDTSEGIDALEEFRDKIAELGNDSDGIMQAFEEYVSKTHDWTGAIAVMKDLGVNLSEGLEEGINEGASLPVDAVADICGRSVNEIKSAWGISSPSTVAAEQGEWFDKGLAKGIEDGRSKVLNAVASLAQDAVTKAREELDINSPSGEGEEIGEYFDEGMAVGIEENTDMVVGATEEMCGEIVEAAKSALFQAELGGAITISTAELAENAEAATEMYENYIDRLERKRDADLIDNEEYYAELEKARDTYLTRNTKEWLDATQELYEGHKKLEEEAEDALEDELKERKNTIDYYHNIGAMNDEEYYAELEKLRDEYMAEDSEEWRSYTEKIVKYQKSKMEDLADEIEDAFDKMADAIEDAADELDDKKEDMVDDLMGVGELFSTGTVTLSNGEELDYASWSDMDKRKEYVEGYFNTMQKLKDLLLSSGGDLDDVNAFMEAIAESGVEDALIAANTLLNSGKALDEFNGFTSLNDFIKEQTDALYGADAAALEEKKGELTDGFCEEVANILNGYGVEIPEKFFDIGKESGEKFGAEFCEKFKDAISTAQEMLTSFYADFQASLDALSGGSYSSVYNFYSSGETTAQQLSAARNNSVVTKFRYA